MKRFLIIAALLVLAGCAQTADTTTTPDLPAEDTQIPDDSGADAPADDSTDSAADSPDDSSDTTDPQTQDDSTDSTDSGTQDDSTDSADADQSEVVELSITGENYAFFMDGEQNPTITVNQGDTVRVTFESTQGLHDFVIDELGAATERVRGSDGSVTVEFVADQAGEFNYYCSVGNHRQLGMEGTFIVE